MKNPYLVVIDVQEKLFPVMRDREDLLSNLEILIQGFKLFGLPIILTEQAPDKLGPTIEPIRSLLEDVQPITKTSFSCAADPAFMACSSAFGGSDGVVLAGIETHVCVNQTVHDLLAEGYCPHLLRDAITSRFSPEDATGWEKMIGSGAVPTCTEAVLFEWLRDSQAAEFKAIHALVV